MILSFDRETTDFQRRRELSPVDAEFLVEEGKFLDFFKVGQVLSVLFDLVHREIIDLRLTNQFGVGFE